MKYPVRLFLANAEVEFSTPPEILFNYAETELTNPTIVKNSYSKTITIEGTEQNNRIFGHIYDLQRVQEYEGSLMGSTFNPLIKTEFTLYYNSSIYESGYFKLDEVRRNDNNIEYDITLYGGLGDFFYNLTYKEDGTNMELSDLLFPYEDETGTELGFTINKEAVKEAWTYIWEFTKWGTINFAPCYNGIPSVLAADKFLINSSGITDFIPTSTLVPSYQYYSIGTSRNEHTEWETFDLRSYLQRPVLRVMEVIKAIANPNNNGGYTVNFDEDFFHSWNPYYFDSWMTLPMLTELDVPATTSTPLQVTAITQEEEYIYNIWDGMGNVTNAAVNLQFQYNPSNGYSGNDIYMTRDYTAWGGVTLDSGFVSKLGAEDCLLVQLLGYNSTDQLVATSYVYRIGSRPSQLIQASDWVTWAIDWFNELGPNTQAEYEVHSLRGKFTKINGQYIFTNDNGTPITMYLRFPSNKELTSIKLKVVPLHYFYREMTFLGGNTREMGPGFIGEWSELETYSNYWQREGDVRARNQVPGTITILPAGVSGTTTSFDNFYSNRNYTKKDLLTLGITPAQFLLSYAKMFGLYFIKDVESKTITILTRHNFYQRDKIVNINDLIDKGSDIKITPASPKYQYYDFALEQVDSEAAKSYQKSYGTQYGAQIVNTGYQFEKEHKNVLDGNCFKAGVTVLERDKYFLQPTNGKPALVDNGFNYWYYLSNNNTDELDRDPRPMTGATINPDGLQYYDAFPKLQFHTEENSPSDGRFVLVICDNFKNVSGFGYHLTDDTQKMYTMNDGQPCWIMTRGTKDRAGDTIALDVTEMPVFTRETVSSSRYIANSFDLGTPQTTYMPKTYVGDWQSIYNKGWKSYISDLYDVNTRVLKCRCLLRERPNPEWLRRFYWFDNCYWRLNAIKDWNISSFGTTEMEFIKVQDIDDYDNIEFTSYPIVELRADTYSLPKRLTTVFAEVYVSDATSWGFGEQVTVEYSDGTHAAWDITDIANITHGSGGATTTPVTLRIPANNTNLSRTIRFDIQDGQDNWHQTYFTQSAEADVDAYPSTFAFTYEAESKELHIEDPNNHGWQVLVEGDWIEVSTPTGTGDTVVDVTVPKNMSGIRSAGLQITDSTSGYSFRIPVIQAANPDE